MKAYLEDCSLRKVIFFTGKGGVGKSTIAWATAAACRKRGLKVTLASWNPFETESPFPHEELGVQWLQLETMAMFREYVLQILKFESLYKTVFDNHVLKTFIRAAPGLPETVIAGKIWNLYFQNQQDLLIVDLPASGHAVSFFQSPLGVQKMFGAGFVHREASKICEMFESPDTRIDLVALPEELPLTECGQLKGQLEKIFPFHFGFLHLNQCTPRFAVPAAEGLAGLPPSVLVCRDRYARRTAEEAEAESLARPIGLPEVQIPRLTTPTMAETIKQVAAFLEER